MTIPTSKPSRKNKFSVGDTVFISYGRDQSGGWWWVEASIRGRMHDISQYRHGGPFRTEAECHKNSQDTLLGPQCEITHGGRWDPAWERPQ